MCVFLRGTYVRAQRWLDFSFVTPADSLKRGVVCRQSQKVEFLNKICKSLWPTIKGSLSKTLKEGVGPMINRKFKPAWIQEIYFKELDFGNNPLQFYGVKGSGDVTPSGSPVAWMDMEFSLNCKESHVVLAVDIVQASPLPPLQLCIVLNNLVVKGNLRVGFGTPIDHWPGFGAVHISFASKPVIDFTLQPLGSYLPQIPPVTLSPTPTPTPTPTLTLTLVKSKNKTLNSW